MNNGTIAHGILMGLAFAVLFPLGAAVLRIGHYSGQLYVHVGLQALAYSMALAGFGLGVWMAVETDQVCSPSSALLLLLASSSLCFHPCSRLLSIPVDSLGFSCWPHVIKQIAEAKRGACNARKRQRGLCNVTPIC